MMEEEANGRLVIRIERRGVRRYTCSGCGRRTGRVRSTRDRTWDDLPWAAHHVTLLYRQRRIVCRHCGIRTERIEFADPKARVTRRLRQQIGVDCQSMPTSHAAVRHGVSCGKARRAGSDGAFHRPHSLRDALGGLAMIVDRSRLAAAKLVILGEFGDVQGLPEPLRDAVGRVESASLIPHVSAGGLVVAGMGG